MTVEYSALPDPPLFDMKTAPRLHPGMAVTVQTMWGDEGGVVLDVMSGRGHGWPMAEVLMDMGDTISIDIARVKVRTAS